MDRNNTYWYRTDRNNQNHNMDYENDGYVRHNNNRRNNRPYNNSYLQWACHRRYNFLRILRLAFHYRLIRYSPTEYREYHFLNFDGTSHNRLNHHYFFLLFFHRFSAVL